MVVGSPTLTITKRHEDLILYKNYIPEEYPAYDNYEAIEVSKIKDIPMDYDGVMGVPVTFLNRHNPDQFEIVGVTQSCVPTGGPKHTLSQIQISADGSKDYSDKTLNRRGGIETGFSSTR